jgi:predicted secreted protein
MAGKGGKIFISYRREDAADSAGRIRDWLVQTQRVAKDDVFMDVTALLPGTDFIQAIEQTISNCKSMIVIISPSWLAQFNAPTASYVRWETEAALRHNLLIIPVLVGGAQMPPPERLPESIRALTRRNARPVRSDSFDYDMGWVQRALGVRTRARVGWLTVVSAILLAALGLGILSQAPEGNPIYGIVHSAPATVTTTQSPTATTYIPPTFTLTPFVPSADKFVGQWDGHEASNSIHQTPTLIRMVITQQGDLLQVGIYSQVGGQLPSSPQDTATGTVSGGQVTLFYTETINGAPFTSNEWILSLPNPGTLHFTHHTHYLQSGDTRPDTDTSGDLHH